MPFISVIVPMYDVEAYVGECVASLRNQTYRDFEVICVDDGSIDASAERAKEAACGDGRFVFASRENGGLSAARNTGLERACGEYVCFLDSDDSYAPDALARLAAAVRSLDVDVLDFSARTEYESRRARRAHREDFEHRTDVGGVLTGEQLFVRYWELDEYVSSACFQLVRRSLLKRADLRFGEGLLHEDELFTPLLYAVAGSAAFLNEPLYIRRMREDSIMTRPPSQANVRSLLRISQLLHAWLIENAAGRDLAFVDAFARNICSIRDVAFDYLQLADELGTAGNAPACEEPVGQALAASLCLQDRIDYDLTVRYVGTRARKRYRELEESITYRVGDAIVALPRAVRERLV